MDEVYSKIGRSALIVFAGIVISTFLKYFFRAILARVYSPSGYGLFYMGVAFLSIMSTLALMGTSLSATRWISYFLPETKKIKGVIYSSLKISIPVSLAVSGVFYLNAGTVAVFFNKPGFEGLLKVFSLGVPFMVFFKLMVSSIRGMQNTKLKVLATDILRPGLGLLFLFLVFYHSFSLVGVTYLYILSFAVTALVSFFFLSSLFDGEKGYEKFSKKRLLRFSWPILLNTLLFFLVEWTDIFMLGFFDTSYSLGIYNAALPVASTLIFVMYAFRYFFLPKSSEILSLNGKKEINDLYSKVVWWIFIIALPGFIYMFFFSHELLSVFFGIEYGAGALVLKVLSLGFFFGAVVGPVGSFFISLGKTKKAMYIALVIGATNMFLNYLLIPEYGYLGAGIALTVSYILGKSIGLAMYGNETGTNPFDTGFLKLFLLSLGLIIPFIFLGDLFSQGFMRVGFTLPFYLVLFYLVVYNSGFFGQGDKEMVDGVLESLKL